MTGADDGRVRQGETAVMLGDQSYRLHYFDRPGAGPARVYVHGLGCSCLDFLEMTRHSSLDGFRLVSFDQPGCGNSPYVGDQPLDIDRLIELFEAFVNALNLSDFVLVGGSMGGLVALLYAERYPTRVSGFVNVEGNLAPEDCMFSRQVVGHSFEEFETEIFPRIKASLLRKRGLGFARHLEVLSRANPRAYYDYSFQLVEYSDHGNLLERFLALRIPKCFVYGAENRHLTYLPSLRASECKLVEIRGANHFPFYDDPVQFAAALGRHCFDRDGTISAT